jgi:hypothetical protein
MSDFAGEPSMNTFVGLVLATRKHKEPAAELRSDFLRNAGPHRERRVIEIRSRERSSDMPADLEIVPDYTVELA